MNPFRRALAGLPEASWLKRIGTSVLVLAVAYLVYAQVSTQVDENRATEDQAVAERQIDTQQEQVIDPLDQVCARDAEVRERLGELCDKAKSITETPAGQGGQGEKGDPGRGIAATAIDQQGHLLITYTDGDVEDKGVVVGADGADGPAGRGVVGSSITPTGRLILSYSDGTSEDAGTVAGPQGNPGGKGDPGRGVVSVTVSADFHLIVSYDDGTAADAGPLPPGPKGDPGRGIVSVAFDFESCTATVSYTDGTSEQAPMTGCDRDPESEPGPPLDPLPGG